MSNAGVIELLANSGAIDGGHGGVSRTSSAVAGGGAGVANSSTIATLTNKGTISGGRGGAGLSLGDAGSGGAGVSNSGTVTTLTNSGTIRGAGGGAGHYAGGGGGGAGVWNLAGARIGALNNASGATIIGGNGGSSVYGGAGGAGVANSGTVKTLTNNGTIGGGAGGSFGGAGGAGIFNSGSIGPLVNGGTIEGGLAASGGAMSDAIYSAGAHASIGPITNSGQIISNVEIDNQASVTVTGGAGKTFGSWAGGTITIGAGNLAFAGGNTALGDNIVVNGGKEIELLSGVSIETPSGRILTSSGITLGVMRRRQELGAKMTQFEAALTEYVDVDTLD